MSTCRGIKIDPYLSPCTKLKFKYITNLNMKPDALNLMEEKVGNTLECIATRDTPLNRTPMVQALRSTTDKRDLMKLQCFCETKDTFNRANQQPVDWERISTKPTSDRSLMSKIYKKLKKLDTNNPKNSTTKKNGCRVQN